MKFLFKLQEIDNPEKLKRCQLENLVSLENFVRTNLYRREIPLSNSEEDITIYYGENRSQENFVFFESDKVLMKKLLEVVTNKPPNFWRKIHHFLESHTYKELRDNHESTLMAILYRSFKNNMGKEPKGFRYERIVMLICAYYYMVGGPLFYGNFAPNLPVPSIHTVRKFILSQAVAVVEGCLRINQLKKFLQDGSYPLKVFLSSDATKIENRITYDHKSNQLIGFVLPLNENKMPITYSFLANSAETMAHHFRHNKIATNLYTYIAQPPVKNAPAFCLLLFGTDETFTSEDVSARQDYITKILNLNGIKVMGYSSDGDPRLLKMMKTHSKLGLQAEEKRMKKNEKILPSKNQRGFETLGFRALLRPPQIYIQDSVHTGNKMKLRLLNESLIFPMGNYFASSGDIVALHRKLGKDKHRLNNSDVTPKDKMNFKATMRLCDPIIWLLLEEHVPNSKGTQMYLKMIYYVTHSYLSLDLNLLQRVYLIWYPNYFLRMWREWLSLNSKNRNYRLSDNFLTSNTYTCIELNAHGLINLILQAIDDKDLDNLDIFQYGSQACEGFFRLLRSLCTTQSMVANCTVSDAINRLQKIQLQHEIISTDFEEMGERIIFERTHNLNPSWDKQKNTIITDVPDFSHLFPISEDSLKTVMEEALSAAKETINSFGMNAEQLKPTEISMDLINASKNDLLDDDEIQDTLDINSTSPAQDNNHNKDDNDDDDISFFDNLNDDLQLKDYIGIFNPDDETSPVVRVVDPRSGESKVVLKTTYCYCLQNEATKLSSDRTVRVRQSVVDKNPHGKSVEDIEIFTKLFIGDWCIFKVTKNEFAQTKKGQKRKRKNDTSVPMEIDDPQKEQYVVGRITNFCYLKQKGRSVRYESRCADIEGNRKSVGVCGHWYHVRENLSLE